MTIFDLVTAPDIVAYWETMNIQRAPYFFEGMFPNDKKLGLDLSYIKGSSGLPVVLKTSAFDVKAVPRNRIGFERMTAEMPFFKESLQVDEKTRQELNMVLQTGNQVYIDTIMNRIFADTVQLLEGAAATRERMRSMAVTTGTILLANNGQEYSYDYNIPENHMIEDKNFNDVDYDVVSAINNALDTVEDDTGVRPTKGVMSRQQLAKLLKNEFIKKNIYVLTNGVGTINQNTIIDYLAKETGVEFAVNTKKYKDEKGVPQQFIPVDTIVLYPDDNLGSTWFGTTPEESDLMTGSTANVAITDTGVAVTTMKMADPVNVETKVSMICLPSFELADQIAIIDTSNT